MKILQVSTASFADPRYYRSNEHAMCRSLAKLGHEVTLFCSDRAPKWQMLEERPTLPQIETLDGFRIRRFRSGPEIGIVPMVPSMLQEIIAADCDIVHAHDMLPPSSCYSALAAILRRKPLVLTQHGYTIRSTQGVKLLFHYFYNNTLGRFTLRAASAVLGLSAEAVKYVEQFGAKAATTFVIPNSVDTTLFQPNGRSLLNDRWRLERPIVLFVARLERRKGVLTLMKAFHDAASEVPNVKLVIVGKGPDESSMLNLQRELNLKNVFFLGRLARHEMPFIYRGADLLVLPSTYEPFGNVVLEAMASGLPVIGSKIAGMADVIADGLTGYHIEPGSVRNLSKRMLELLTNEKLRKRMSRAARSSAVERFDDMVIAKSIENVYRRCIGS